MVSSDGERAKSEEDRQRQVLLVMRPNAAVIDTGATKRERYLLQSSSPEVSA